MAGALPGLMLYEPDPQEFGFLLSVAEHGHGNASAVALWRPANLRQCFNGKTVPSWQRFDGDVEPEHPRLLHAQKELHIKRRADGKR